MSVEELAQLLGLWLSEPDALYSNHNFLYPETVLLGGTVSIWQLFERERQKYKEIQLRDWVDLAQKWKKFPDES